MIPAVQRTLGVVSLALAAGLLAGLSVLRDLEDAPPAVPVAGTGAAAVAEVPLPGAVFGDRFGSNAWRRVMAGTNLTSAFVTTYFRPPPPPPPPVRKTQKFRLAYQGYFETADGVQRAYVQVDDRLQILPPGARVVGDVVIDTIDRLELRLRQAGTQTVVVPFRGSREVEVPVE
ncbi:MAG: hypothetical protein KatS3mg132_284 [Limisphaera sp.]|nr:MAG: hypothetical protein KatS3mg132_284 [Limisphaera sp.]